MIAALSCCPGTAGAAAELADRDLLVLCPDLGDHVVGRESVGLELARIEPDAHRVLRAEGLHVADAGDARDRVDDVRGDEVGDVVLAHAAVFGDEADDHQESGAALLTLMPCSCTICGSSGVTSCSLFCTCTCAMSGSVPLSNVSVIVAWPLDSLVADM